MLLDLNAVRQQAGLEIMLGDPLIAFHTGPQADLAKLLHHSEYLICVPCAAKCSIWELLQQETGV